MIDYETFIRQNLGKPVEKEDPSAPDQCMDWAFAYLDDVLGIDRATIRHQYAYQVWTMATDFTRQYFDLVPVSNDNPPKKGDLVIFSTVVGYAGHIVVASGNADKNAKTFQSTDQNWNGHKFIEYVWHSYNGVLGALRPKKPVAGGITLDQALADLRAIKAIVAKY